VSTLVHIYGSSRPPGSCCSLLRPRGRARPTDLPGGWVSPVRCSRWGSSWSLHHGRDRCKTR
jgi:hypothetical protein